MKRKCDFRVLFVTQTKRQDAPYMDPSVRYRCYNPAEAMADMGCLADVVTSARLDARMIENYDAFVSYPDETLPASVITQAPQDVANLFSTDAMQQLFIKVLSGSKSVETAFMELQTKANEKWSTIAN